MPKYGRGLNRELVGAVNAGVIGEPFSTSEIRKLVQLKNWHPPPTDSYINVALSNGSSADHSLTYKKYFILVGNGKYRLRESFRGPDWL